MLWPDTRLTFAVPLVRARVTGTEPLPLRHTDLSAQADHSSGPTTTMRLPRDSQREHPDTCPPQ